MSVVRVSKLTSIWLFIFVLFTASPSEAAAIGPDPTSGTGYWDPSVTLHARWSTNEPAA